jgi:hypothetical protein
MIHTGLVLARLESLRAPALQRHFRNSLRSHAGYGFIPAVRTGGGLNFLPSKGFL